MGKRMPKWWYWGMSFPFYILAIVFGIIQFVDGFPWGYVGFAFAVAGRYCDARFKELDQSAPEE